MRFIYLSILATCVFLNAQASFAAEESCWLVAHTPENELLVKRAEDFNAKVKKRTEGRVNLKLQFPPEKDRDGHDFATATESIYKNECQISQISTEFLTKHSPVLSTIGLPYIFPTHAIAAKILDGEIGAEIKKTAVEESKNIRPLAFTYSGGYRVMATSKPINSVKELSGLVTTYRKKLDSVRFNTFKSLGIKKVSRDVGVHETNLQYFAAGHISYFEDHYGHFSRIIKKFPETPIKITNILETNHNLYMTSIVVNETFYQSLSAEDRKVLEEETQALALLERQDSIDSDQKAKEFLEAKGIAIKVADEKFKDDLKDRFKSVYNKVDKKFSTLVKRMQSAAKENAKLTQN